ncbi:hypothetical protein PPTG_21133 [Phytophthora nicotianae INRA-310]|uniref:ZSWIM1/3 RNaseH-like domain-containing protein n=1 Tax=Phytophthora nicotianae (strain INRA-310) TaxID=761204 RepID=W2RB64_PHYN3|nr:hypothetical protein PPTG_21133 [Phytophthora nicotianae INRA-310]ETN21765.1 hypothetical protein PPTG_21133 [Phytophthora nicotianae INRA-310]
MARLTAVVKRIAMNEYEIKIQNQHHTHSHPTSSIQAASYLTTTTLPLDDQDREDVKTLADACVSSTHIANFLNDRIREDRLKDMLQLDGSDVQVIQDHTARGIIIKTKIQKMMFERWGETLAMDLTHNRNNLGYHLGEFVGVWSPQQLQTKRFRL